MTRKQKQVIFTALVLLLFAIMLIASLITNRCIPMPFHDSSSSVSETNIRCNINTASVPELEQVYGLERETAIQIVAYRERNGRYYSVSELLNVPTMTDEQYMKAFAFLVCE